MSLERSDSTAAGGAALESGFLVLQALTRDLRPLPPTPAPEIVEMEMRHPPDVERYLEVHNSAFPQPWGPRDFEGAILENPSKRITRTFMILERGRAIAAASIGVYRRNPQVGVGHYIGVRPECQRQGIGRWLALYRFHRLAEEGLATVEIETRLRYRASILLHLGLGLRPKPSPDSWNSPQSETPELTRATAAAVRELLAAWGRGESAR